MCEVGIVERISRIPSIVKRKRDDKGDVMTMPQNAKKLLDLLCTVVVTIAAAFLIWTEVEKRWIRAPRPRVQDIEHVTIEARKVRHVKGEGSVAIVEFTDYECPFCRQFAKQVAPDIEKELIDTGIVRHVVFNFPLELIHPNARGAAEAAECAARQGHYWEMHKRLFATVLKGESFRQLGESLGLEQNAFSRCVSGETRDIVRGDLAEAQRLHVEATPTFFIGTVLTDGSVQLSKRVNGVVALQEIRDAISAVVGQKSVALRSP